MPFCLIIFFIYIVYAPQHAAAVYQYYKYFLQTTPRHHENLGKPRYQLHNYRSLPHPYSKKLALAILPKNSQHLAALRQSLSPQCTSAQLHRLEDPSLLQAELSPQEPQASIAPEKTT